MIPKVIHYCWFGGREKPTEVIERICAWKKILPDYDIVEWNEQNFDINQYPYTQEAYKVGKYAFVSDVCRMKALTHGGIYLDTDVDVLQSFNAFLHHDSFIGWECKNRLGTAVIGASSDTQWIKDFLTLYKSLRFIKKLGKFDLTPNTSRITTFFNQYEGVRPSIYPIDVFSAKDYRSGKILVTKNTICIHNFSMSWVETPKIEKIEKRLYKTLHLPDLNLLNKIKWLPSNMISWIKKKF